jgi:hypothetical protein
MALKIIILILLSIGALAVFIAMYKSEHFVKSLLLTAFQGIASMLCVNALGLVTGVTIAVNWYTIATVSFFGMPSCIALTIMQLIIR